MGGPARPIPGGSPPNPPGGGGPPIPIAGPPSPTGKPLPAGLLMPVPACMAAGAPPGALWPNLADGSDGGGPSTEHETMWVPRRIVRPSVRFSSDSTAAPADPGAGGAVFVFFLFTLRNSSVSARTRFICLSNASI
jgi:hypothetical protein